MSASSSKLNQNPAALMTKTTSEMLEGPILSFSVAGLGISTSYMLVMFFG